MAQKKLENMTVEELREEAAKADVEGRSGMNKEELQKALSHEDAPKTAAPKAAAAPQAVSTGQMQVLGSEFGGKNPTRLFQTGPHEKTWLTKDQAREKGFYWKD